MFSFFFFFNDTATTEIYTLSLHDALPICQVKLFQGWRGCRRRALLRHGSVVDRKSTRLNSSHRTISYAVFCLKKKNTITMTDCLPPPLSTSYSPIANSRYLSAGLKPPTPP